MSLINEALKRAKEAQSLGAGGPQAGNGAPLRVPRLELRPAEPAHHAATSRPSVLPIALTMVAVAGLFFLWQASSRHPSGATTAALAAKPESANTFAAKAAASADVERPSASKTAAPPTAGPERKPTAQPATATPALSSSPALASAAATNSTGSVADAPSGVQTTITAAAVATEPPAAPPALRLQAILFTPSHPSAMINGKTVYAGDRLGELRVVAIGRDHATLSGPSGTNVLTLPE